MENLIPVGISNRHIHLSEADIAALFGAGYKLTTKKPLSQPGQFAAEEVVTIVGPKGQIEKVRILGPARKASQIEVSQTDAYKLGITAPVRDSGDIENSPGVTMIGPKGEVALSQGAILAGRHVHMHPQDAAKFGVKDKDRVEVITNGERSVTFGNVLVRVSDQFALELHVDTDEANAALLRNGETVKLRVNN